MTDASTLPPPTPHAPSHVLLCTTTLTLRLLARLTRWGALVAALAASAPATLRAQSRELVSGPPSSYFWRSVDTDHGLPETQVLAVTQTPDGFLWLGTKRGVVRYDGLNFRHYSPESHPEFGSGIVNSLATDRRGQLWIATERGLTVESNGQLHRIPTTSVPDTMTWKVVEDRKGRYWVAGAFGVVMGDGTTFRRVSGATRYTYSLYEDPRGRMWMVGRDFLGSIGEGDTTVVQLPLQDGERLFEVVGDGGDGMWVGTRNGAWRIDTRDPHVLRVLEKVATGTSEIGNEVWALTRSPDGLLWLGTETKGVLQWDGTHLSRFAIRDARSDDQVWSLYSDVRGRVWAGTSAGITRFQRSPFTTVNDGLQPTSVWGIVFDAQRTMWAATTNGSIARFENEKWVEVVKRFGRNLSSSLARTPDGRVYALWGGRTLYRLDASGAHSDPTVASPPARTDGLFVDTDGALWFMSDSGVFRAKGTRAELMQGALGLDPQDRPLTMARDGRGRLLIGAPGLTVVDGGRATRYGVAEGLTDLQVHALFADDRDNVWIGTADSGLYVLRHGRIAHLGDVDPRLKREIGGIALDKLGYLWLTSSFGLSRVSRAQLEDVVEGRTHEANVRHFDRSDGLPSTEFNSDFVSTIPVDSAGILWLPSFSGVVRVDPARISADTLPPQVHLDRVVVDGTEIPLGRAVTLRQHAHRVELTFAVTNALVPTRTRVEYRMIGIDSVWHDAEGRHTAAFGPLRGGQYRFEVRAASEDGAWNPVDATLDLTVARTLPEQLWFYPILVSAAAMTVFLLVRWRQRRLEERGRALEAQVEERTRDLEASHATLERRVEERTAALQHELEERRRLEQRLLESQKLESIGRLAGGVAHEINNSMTAVLGFAELAQVRAHGQGALEEDLRDVVRAGRRVADITRQLLAFARRQQSQPVPLQLQSLVRGLERAMQQASGPMVRVVVETTSNLPPILADAGQVEQLLINLVKNASDAMPGGGTTTIRVHGASLGARRDVGGRALEAGSYVILSVSDTGVGISDDVRSKLFEPFFTTKELNKGTGLGLAVCHGIVASHHGAIDVSSAVGMGATFTVWFPAHMGTIAAQPANDVLSTGRETILLAEDEPTVRALTTRMLELQGYRVLAAEDGRAAMQLAERVHGAFDLVLSDVMMPEMTGPELVSALRMRRPALPIVFMSGYAGPGSADVESLTQIGTLLTKPFTREALSRAVRDALDGRTTAAVGVE